MFCKYCGNELPDGTTFCPNCGKDDTPAVIEENKVETNCDQSLEYTIDIKEEIITDHRRDSMASDILKFAIMGLAFGSSFYLSVIGLIFSIISRVKLKKYLKIYDQTDGKATVGKHISLAGLIVCIAFTAWILYSGAVAIINEVFGVWLDPLRLL